MVADGGRRVLRVAEAGVPDIEVTRDNETMIRGMVVSRGGGV